MSEQTPNRLKQMAFTEGDLNINISPKEFKRATHENGKCLHNIGSKDSDGYFRCLYCGSIINDLDQYRPLDTSSKR